jgi:hypothetical protein
VSELKEDSTASQALEDFTRSWESVCIHKLGGPLVLEWEEHVWEGYGPLRHSWWLPRGEACRPEFHGYYDLGRWGKGVNATAEALWEARQSPVNVGIVLVRALLFEHCNDRRESLSVFGSFIYNAHQNLPRFGEYGRLWHHRSSHAFPSGVSHDYDELLREPLYAWDKNRGGRHSPGSTLWRYLCSLALVEYVMSDKLARLVHVEMDLPGQSQKMEEGEPEAIH